MSTLSAQEQLRLLTFNIRYANPHDGVNYWEHRKERTYKVIRAFNPDIFGVQEALDEQNRDLGEAFSEYGRLGVGRDDGDSLGEHCSIFYRKSRFEVITNSTFWFSDTPDTIASKHFGNRLTRICTWAHFRDIATQISFFLYNLHIDHESQPSREKSILCLLEQIGRRGTKDPVFVMGDFNAEEQNPAVLLIQSQNDVPLRDTFRVMNPDAEAVATFHGYTGVLEGDKIDYIFAAPNFEIVESSIIRTCFDEFYPSDHFPVSLVGYFAPQSNGV